MIGFQERGSASRPVPPAQLVFRVNMPGMGKSRGELLVKTAGVARVLEPRSKQEGCCPRQLGQVVKVLTKKPKAFWASRQGQNRRACDKISDCQV